MSEHDSMQNHRNIITVPSQSIASWIIHTMTYFNVVDGVHYYEFFVYMQATYLLLQPYIEEKQKTNTSVSSYELHHDQSEMQ